MSDTSVEYSSMCLSVSAESASKWRFLSYENTQQYGCV